MGRMYSASAQRTAQTAAQDVIELLAATNVAVIIHEVEVTSNLTTDERNRIILHRGTASGSGGAAGTEVGLETGLPAADSAIEFGNTTQSVEANVLRSTEWSCLVPYHYLPTPETRIVVPGGGLFIVELAETITSTTLSATIVWEELG